LKKYFNDEVDEDLLKRKYVEYTIKTQEFFCLKLFRGALVKYSNRKSTSISKIKGKSAFIAVGYQGLFFCKKSDDH